MYRKKTIRNQGIPVFHRESRGKAFRMAYSGCFFVVLRLGVFGKAFCPVKISGKMDRYKEQPVLEKTKKEVFCHL